MQGNGTHKAYYKPIRKQTSSIFFHTHSFVILECSQHNNVHAILIIVQQDATQSSLLIILQVHCTCFGCQTHPSSGVHKTVTTASGTGHIFVQVLAWPRWKELAEQYRRL